MIVLQVYPIKKQGGIPPSWCYSQINSLKPLSEKVSELAVLRRKNLIHLIQYGFKLRRKIKNDNIEIVHCQWGTSLALFTVLFSNVPVVLSFCGSDLLGNYSKNNKKTFSGMVSSTLSKVASVFSNHNITKSKILFNAIPKIAKTKTSIVPNGINSINFHKKDKTQARIKLNLPENKTIVLFVNSIGSWEKNQAFARKIGNEIEKIKNFHYLEVDNVPFDEMPDYYSSADFLLITSFHEGSSNVLKEALFCGLKIVTTPTGDSRERLEGLEECLVSDNLVEIVDHIKKNKNKKLTIGKSDLNKIELTTIANVITDLYVKVLHCK